MAEGVMVGELEKGQVVDLDELVGLLSYVIEGVAMAPERPIPWGGISKLVKDINSRTSRIRQLVEEGDSIVGLDDRVRSGTERPPGSAVPSRTETNNNSESVVETEVDNSLQASSLARRIQMAPRPPAGRVREVPLQEPR